MLVDEAFINIKAGKGGDGVVLFRREKFVPKGGPWGGDGGKGGDVYLLVLEDIGLLGRYVRKKDWNAEDGRNGGSAKKQGRKGNDLVLPVPIGTYVTNLVSGETLDLVLDNQRIIIAHGGRGGRGNCHFATALNRVPRIAEKGLPGEKLSLKLELKIIANLGLIGFPNTGKTSLLNTLTGAKAKTADYKFTTLDPNLGVMDGIVIADLPGIIKGASKGKGLGIRFLKHISRTRMLAYLISSESADPARDYRLVRKELEDFGVNLQDKREFIIISKSDLLKPEEILNISAGLKKYCRDIFSVSIIDDASLSLLRKFIKRKISNM